MLLGQDIQPKRDLSRFVRWPKYIRLQRQKAVLMRRLKVPPTINQFTQGVDRQLGNLTSKTSCKKSSNLLYYLSNFFQVLKFSDSWKNTDQNRRKTKQTDYVHVLKNAPRERMTLRRNDHQLSGKILHNCSSVVLLFTAVWWWLKYLLSVYKWWKTYHSVWTQPRISSKLMV